MKKPRKQNNRQRGSRLRSIGWVADVLDCVPTNWLDPLLTGKDRVIGDHPYNGRDIERLLRAVRERIRIKLKSATDRTKLREGRRKP